MTERPILFSGPMVRAIIEGRKTQTRRVMNPQPVKEKEFLVSKGVVFKNLIGGQTVSHTPYGRIGDRLWVRETWRPIGVSHQQWVNVLYRADDEQRECPYFAPRFAGSRWRPAIHMPRLASRLTLEVTGVRVERVQEISENDAKAEGVCKGPQPVMGDSTHRRTYEALWDKLNAKRGHGWATNPWVWVIEFKRTAAPERG